MRTNDQRRRVEIRSLLRRQHAQHIAPGLLLLLDVDLGRHRHSLTIEPAHQIPRIELILQFLQRLARRLEQRLRQLIRHTDCRHTR